MSKPLWTLQIPWETIRRPLEHTRRVRKRVWTFSNLFKQLRTTENASEHQKNVWEPWETLTFRTTQNLSGRLRKPQNTSERQKIPQNFQDLLTISQNRLQCLRTPTELQRTPQNVEESFRTIKNPHFRKPQNVKERLRTLRNISELTWMPQITPESHRTLLILQKPYRTAHNPLECLECLRIPQNVSRTSENLSQWKRMYQNASEKSSTSINSPKPSRTIQNHSGHMTMRQKTSEHPGMSKNTSKPSLKIKNSSESIWTPQKALECVKTPEKITKCLRTLKNLSE